MKLLFIADGRSPIAKNWIGYFAGGRHEVHMASTFPADPLPGLSSFHVIPIAFSAAAGQPESGGGSLIRRLTTPQLRMRARQWLGVLTLGRAAHKLGKLIAALDPDLVHAMRIPYEGMAAAAALGAPSVVSMRSPPPLLVSIWGNDFTLHAQSNPSMARQTRRTLQNAAAVHADCRRDIRLAHQWGFSRSKVFTVLPGAGGVQAEIFYPPESPENPDIGGLTIIQPRGSRAYVQNDVFFQAIPLVLEKHPNTCFVCPGLAQNHQAEEWISKLGLKTAVRLLPQVPREEMAAWFRRSTIMLSPTTHDGTPNTLLEALACGCFPVAGDLESIREWITPGENGILVNPREVASIAAGLLVAIENPAMRARARQNNFALIRERGNYPDVMRAAAKFYQGLRTRS